MTFDLVVAFFVFALVGSVTPGPNNMMLLSSGLTFGFRRTIPHMLGVSFGHAAMVLCIGLGLGEVFERLPWLNTALKIFGALYMLYLAWKIAHAGPAGAADSENSKPLTFIQAALFQWINPKGVIMAISAVSIYTRETAYLTSLLVVAGGFLLTNLVAVTTWTGFGTGLRQFLSDPVTVRRFNIVMAVLLVLSLIPILLE